MDIFFASVFDVFCLIFVLAVAELVSIFWF